MITVTEEEIQRWKALPETPMKWDDYPWDIGEERIPVTVAFGAGLNSTAMVIGAVFQGQPLDLILFADTGNERPETYTHRDQVSEWLQEHGYPGIETVSRDGDYESLGDRCEGENMGPSLAYGFGNKGCSKKWKVTPQRKRIKRWEPAQRTWERGEYIIKLIGYDVGETHRYQEAYDDDNGYEFEYPLVDWKWDRDDCERVIMFADGICRPPKSACFFCPSSKPQEILELRRKHPDLFQKAIEIEKAMQSTLQEESSIEGLAGKHSWQDIVKAADEQPDLIDRIDTRTMECDCYDGERSRDEEMNEYLAEKVDPEEKELPFQFERASEFDEMIEAKRAGGEANDGETKVDVSVEQLEMTIPESPPPETENHENGEVQGDSEKTEKKEFKPSLKIDETRKVGLERLVDQLLEWDFSQVDHVKEPGEFAWRGNTVDVHPRGDGKTPPVRIEFFGDKIMRLRSLSTETQRTVGPASSFDLYRRQTTRLAKPKRQEEPENMQASRSPKE